MILAFFTVFMYQLFGSLMVSNVIYYFLLLRSIIGKKTISYIKNKRINMWLFLFIMWVTVSTSVYVLQNDSVEFRNIVQLFFTLQYIVFIIHLSIDWSKFESWVFRFSVFLSALILVLFALIGPYNDIPSLFTAGRLWAQDYIPGWPNTTPIGLLFGLYIGMKKNKPAICKVVLILALILTTSRAAILGVVLILSYFVYKKTSSNKMKSIIVLFPILITLALFSGIFIQLIYELIPSLEYRMGISYDREDIIHVTMSYIRIRPMLGFGGSSIDQIIPIYGNPSAYGLDWRHTHSWILETMLRYGLVGVFFFAGFLVSLLRSIKDSDDKFMFALVLVLGLFQTYLRNFSVLMLMLYLLNSYKNKHDMKKNNG